MSSTKLTETANKLIKFRKGPFNVLNSDIKYLKVIPCKQYMKQIGFKEDIIYKASENDFLKGKYPNLVIVNKLNTVKCSSRTVATYTRRVPVELTSDAVTRVIGQNNYDTLFSALCSIINPQLRIEGILSLLTDHKQTSVHAQTDKSYSAQTIKEKQNKSKTKRKTVTSYAVKDDMLNDFQIKKVVIDPQNVKLLEPVQIKVEPVQSTPDTSTQLPELNEILCEDSNQSNISLGNISSISDFSIGSAIDNFINSKTLTSTVENHTEVQTTDITMLDGSIVTINGNPDIFHLATPEILQNLSQSDKGKLLCYQAYIDWKFCLLRQDGNLPLHSAVINNDVVLLKRHCTMLKSKNVSVDIPTEDNETALQLSIQQDRNKCTAVLLQHGADPTVLDEESKNAVHLAAEVSPENMEAVLDSCQKNAREILISSSFWRTDMEKKSDQELAAVLVQELCGQFDDSGYTPLMAASRSGRHENISMLLKASPLTINMRTPTSGDTALFLAVTAACIESRDSSDQTKVSPNYMKTVEILMRNGADPAIDNMAGSNVNTLLTEFYIKELSMLIAHEFTSCKYFDGKLKDKFNNYIIVKNENGTESIEKIDTKKNKTSLEPQMKPLTIGTKSAKVMQNGNTGDVTKVIEAKKPIILRKPIKLNINKTKILPILLTKNPKISSTFKRSSEDISEDSSTKKIKPND